MAEYDQVDRLPHDIKDRFGEVVWAQAPHFPPWPGIIFDPRCVPDRKLRNQAYQTLKKCFMVRFYGNEPTWYSLHSKYIEPFVDDPEELAKRSKHVKQKSLLKELPLAVEGAQKAAGISQAERLEWMQGISQLGASLKRDKPQKMRHKALDDDAPSPPSVGGDDSASDANGGLGEGSGNDDNAESSGDEGSDQDDSSEEASETEPSGGSDEDDEEFVRERRRARQGKRTAAEAAGACPRKRLFVPDSSEEDVENEPEKPMAARKRGSADYGEENGKAAAAEAEKWANATKKERALEFVRAYCRRLPALRPPGAGADESDGDVAASGKSRKRRGGGDGTRSDAKRRRRDCDRLPKTTKQRVRDEADHKQRLAEMKQSSEPIFLQAQRDRERSRGSTSGGSGSSKTADSKAAAAAAAAGKAAPAETPQERMLRLTKILEGASAGTIAAAKAIKAMAKLQTMPATVELLRTSGSGLAVSALRKHADPEVAQAARRLKKHWLEELQASAAAPPGEASTKEGNGAAPAAAPAAVAAIEPSGAAAAGAPAKTKLAKAAEVHRTAAGGSSTASNGHAEAKPLAVEAAPVSAAVAVAAPKAAEAAGLKAAPAAAVPAVAAAAAASAPAAPGQVKAAPAAAAAKRGSSAAAAGTGNLAPDLPAPRRRAIFMLRAVLGATERAARRCLSVEQALFEAFPPPGAGGTGAGSGGCAEREGQGRGPEASGGSGPGDTAVELLDEEYLRRLRVAVFEMEGEAGRMLRDRVLSGVILPIDFVAKSAAELRTMARL